MERDLLVFGEFVPLEVNTLLRDVHPETAMASYAGCTLDCEADSDRVAGLWCNVDVLARDIGRAVVVELQEVHLVGNHGSWDHDGGEERERRGARVDSSVSSKLGLPRGGW